MTNNNYFSMMKSEEELKEMEEILPGIGVKNLIVAPDGRYGLFKIKWDDGKGVLPDKLKGRFTSMLKAEKAVERYVRNNKTQVSAEDRRADADAERMARTALGVKEEVQLNDTVSTKKEFINAPTYETRAEKEQDEKAKEEDETDKENKSE